MNLERDKSVHLSNSYYLMHCIVETLMTLYSKSKSLTFFSPMLKHNTKKKRYQLYVKSA